MRSFAAVVLMLASSLSFAQVHITQPFKFFWDEAAVNVNGTAGQPQVQHFELKVDSAAAVNVVPLGGTVVNAGFVTFSQVADPTLLPGTHSFLVRACSSASSTVGCVDSGPFAFVLDPIAPPAPTNLRVQ